MNISLTPELDSYVHKKVETGMYHSASEVIREGLRLLRERDERHLASLRAEIDIGIAQIERGEYTEYTAESLSGWAEEMKIAGMKILAERQAKRLNAETSSLRFIDDIEKRQSP